MKANKPDSSKKISKKAEKKALEQSLTAKLFEAVKSLGHDAEKIGEDLVLVSKFVAKKIAKRVKPSKQEEVKAAKKQAKCPKPAVAVEKAASETSELSSTEQNPQSIPAGDLKGKPKPARAPKKTEALLKKVAAKPKAMVTSVDMATEPVVAEPEADVALNESETPKPAAKSPKRTSPVQKKAAPKKSTPAVDEDKKHIN